MKYWLRYIGKEIFKQEIQTSVSAGFYSKRSAEMRSQMQEDQYSFSCLLQRTFPEVGPKVSCTHVPSKVRRNFSESESVFSLSFFSPLRQRISRGATRGRVLRRRDEFHQYESWAKSARRYSFSTCAVFKTLPSGRPCDTAGTFPSLSSPRRRQR